MKLLSYSGGIDSTAILLKLIKENKSIHCFVFDYGQTKDEIVAAEKICKKLQVSYSVLDVRNIFPSKKTHEYIIPNRNAIFLNILYSHAIAMRADEIYIGTTLSDSDDFPDCRESFIRFLEDALNRGNEADIRIETPFSLSLKSSVIKFVIHYCRLLNLDPIEILRMTHSSYDDLVDGRATGKTISDLERLKAFELLGMRDPIEYL